MSSNNPKLPVIWPLPLPLHNARSLVEKINPKIRGADMEHVNPPGDRGPRNRSSERGPSVRRVTIDRAHPTSGRRSPWNGEGIASHDEEESLISSTFTSVFCPRSFRKGRLAAGYARFQSFDTLQALCSYLRGVLCTQALLKGLGVGSSEASAGAATITFITKDMTGMLGSLGLAWACSESFGRNIKAWRLFADVANDIALALDLYAPRFAPSNTFVVLVCISSILKAWCGVSAGATRAAITSHFALHSEDIADVAAKEGSQETAVTLLGMILGYLFLKYESDPSDVQTNLIWGLFWFLTGVHVWANYEAVRSLHFRTLDWTRLDIVLANKKRTFAEVSALEPIFPHEPPVPFPEFGVIEEARVEGDRRKYERHNYVTSSQFHNVALFGSRIVVGLEASARDVICAALAVRWVQLNTAKSLPPSELAISAVNIMPSFLGIVEILEQNGWDLESSRALLGDTHEKRVQLSS